MRIVYCIPGLYNSGGMERVLSCKANYLASLGHEIHIVTTDQMGRPCFFPLDERIRTYDLGVNYEINNGGSLWHKLSTYYARQRRHRRELTALLMRIRPDVTVSMFGNDEGIIPSIQDGSRKVLEYHFSKLKRLQYGRRGLWRLIDHWRTKADERAVRRYDRFVVLTEEDRQLWGDLPNIRVIANPLPFDTEQTSTLTARRVIAAGRYDYQKNFEALIDIWAQVSPQFPDWHLDIYGDGPLRGALEERVERLGLSGTLSLQKPTRDMPAEYLRSALYAMTSHYEGLPMVLLEAQTMGLPIVSYACQCGPRDIVADGETGYLVDLYDEQAFVARLMSLMASEGERQRMGANAREASQRYRLERIMPQWEQLFEELYRTR